MKTSNMYSSSKKQWNPFVGCCFSCLYCDYSFKAQAKRQKHRCLECYDFQPHEHSDRLTDSLPKTNENQFIFACSNGDIAFASIEYRQRILDRIKELPDRTFLVQTKNPAIFKDVKLPDNVILGTTIETNDDEFYKSNNISKAPLPSTRYEDLRDAVHSRKMVTIEPVIKMDIALMISWLKEINPETVWIGIDSKKPLIGEPSLEEFDNYVSKIKAAGFNVNVKTRIRKSRNKKI